MRRAALWAAVAAAVVGLASARGAGTTYTHGYDVSWPQCAGGAARSMPSASDTRFVILGLTHGAGHTVNPCLSAQLAWAKAHHVPVGAYLVPSYPTAADLAAASAGPAGVCGSDRGCRLANDGAAQATDAVETMRRYGVPAPMVWVDVEFRRVHSWTRNHADNARVIDGVFTGLHAAGLPYGVYTTSYMWSHIVGGWRVQVPNWLPSGDGKPATARSKCRDTGTGGVTWIAQYTRRLDENLTCPVMDAVPGRPGPLYRWRNTTLHLGSTGAAVTALQRALGTQVSGTYDVTTTAAVVAYQAQHELPPDGRVDADDWRALGAYRLYGGHPFLLPQVVAPVS